MAKFVDNETRRAPERLAAEQAKWNGRGKSAFQAVGAALDAVIERRGLPKAVVAAAVGVTPAALSRWCAGVDVPNGRRLDQLGACLGVDPSFFVTFRPDVIAKLTKAVRPGEFLPETEDAVVRESERVARERSRLAKEAEEQRRQFGREQRQATRDAKAEQQEEDRERRGVMRSLDRIPRANWRARFDIAGKRCIYCATKLRAPGICDACHKSAGGLD